ncbi:hypothetical protein G6F61_013337 [Rhizopus arrhizus]|nr:hypothetical protein G6F61_013337 [Rhizopus arrhizus]
MTAAETVDQYVERFNNLRRLAQIQDRCVLTRCFLIGLQADIYKKVVVSLANCTDAEKESVDYVVKLAKNLYNSLYGQLGVQATMDKSLDLELNRS